MKKQVIITLALCACALGAWGNVVTGVAAIPDGYYNGVSGKKGADNILNALQTCITTGYNEIAYKGLEPHYLKTDFYADTLWDMYSTCRFDYEDANKAQSALCDGWNKEHVCCQSWLGNGPMVSDMFNVYPTDARVNNLRSNYPYGVVSGSSNGMSSDPDKHALGKLGNSALSGYSGKVYEPDDRYKGDFARTFFYMVARYRNNTLNSSEGSNMFTSSPTNLTAYSLSFLLQWHRNDPVSEKEIDRNQGVYGEQKNRNPFIDYPDLVEYIWGDLVGQTVDLSSMTPTCEGGGSTPIVVIKHGVTWTVNGEELSVDSIKENKKPELLPESPTSCSSESSEFVGWTNTPISGISNNAPAVLYTKAADFPAVTADITYYAVFAHKEIQGGSAPAVYTYDETHQDGWTNTGAWTNNSYWLLDAGKILTSPEIDLAGLSSIEVNMRTYGGTQYCNLDVKAGNTQIATIEATGGKTLKDYTWNNTAVLSGSSALTFSTNYGENQGIGFTKVVINATGAGAVYDRYITSCQTATEIINTSVDEQAAKKILIGGQMYILVGEQLFTITGQRIK
ncbi:MAG: endonuclease [Paludibacteraceae bacterium]|nr:endonuclease [Paludibacteraceae bacterium]